MKTRAFPFFGSFLGPLPAATPATDESSVSVKGQGVDIIPEVASSYKPVKGMRFSSIDQAFDFYCEYAKKAGFGARKGGSYVHGGVLKTKYFTCCKEGHKPAKMYISDGGCDESRKPYYKRRKRPTIRCGCRAHIQLKSVDSDFFEVDDFVEGHNHRMVAASDMQFVRSARKLTHVQEEAIYELSNMNLGPVKEFNLMRTLYGGFEKILCAKKTFSSDYYFEYDVNDDRELIHMFWVDETSKSNYLAFGDIISFDATFKTNKYKMVFVPFTAIDNHCHSVTVGVGLLASETIESYTWLLQMLLKSFGHAPKVVVTDQDPAMKQVIAALFPNTRHKLCIWLIMKKVVDKRYNGRRCDHDSRYTYPQLETRSYLETEAVRIYTRAIFNDLQDEMNEIVGSVSQFSSCEEEGGFLRCKIMDFNAYVPGFLEVVFKKDGEFGEESIATCSCKRFEQYGLLCRHIFYVMNMYQVKKFPKIYINDRWMKEVAVNIRTDPMSEFGNDQNRKIKEISREIKYASEYLINSYVADIDELIKVRDEMNLMIEKADLTRYEKVRPSKRYRFAVVLGFEQPSEVTVRVPTGIRNKGRGSHKRIKSMKEIAISRYGKGYREC
ncbi:protein FAR1-RELATED SEQUENCE 5-like [Bidens hawaiensis]|uniref:protein FAR1-RELATED SEQUENCE 5-like n=1 Tax=Bidens hawaiensis TaxID=980011 RepID=UPI00404A27F9